MKIITCTLAAVGLTAALTAAAEPAKPAEPATHSDEAAHQTLFDGANLDAWHVSGCEVAIEDQSMKLVSGDGFVRTLHPQGDFELELKWKALPESGYDAGIYFRSELPPEGRPWPRRYQINLKDGDEGNLIGVKSARSAGLIRKGDWNHFRLRVVGPSAELEINGKPAWKTDAIEAASGYIGIQAEVPLGGQFLFRDIRITELDHRPLFNGRDLTGWEGAGAEADACWKVSQDGLLMCTGDKGPWLRSAAQHRDFNLRLDYKVRPGGNSGVYVRVPSNGNHHGKDAGLEVQVLDDAAPRYAKLKDYQYSASLYAIAPASPRTSRPAGQWNSLEINALGGAYRVIHNGVEVIRADEQSHPLLVERLKAGYLGLQNHSEEVWFRNLRIGSPLDPAPVDR